MYTSRQNVPFWEQLSLRLFNDDGNDDGICFEEEDEDEKEEEEEEEEKKKKKKKKKKTTTTTREQDDDDDDDDDDEEEEEEEEEEKEADNNNNNNNKTKSFNQNLMFLFSKQKRASVHEITHDRSVEFRQWRQKEFNCRVSHRHLSFNFLWND